jgi:hypothetical protein
MPSTFRRTIALHRAACDASQMLTNPRRRFAYHFVEMADSIIKIERDSDYTNSPAIRGAIAWAIRKPGRQVTICRNGKLYFD